MKKISVVFVILLLMTLVVGLSGCDMYGTSSTTAITEAINSDQNVGISVTGTGEVDVTPDIALVNIGVQVQMETLSEAQQQAAESMAAVMDALKNKNVADNDIQTANYSIQPVWEWVDNENVFKGYKVVNIVNAKIRDMDAIGDIIDAAVDAGGEYVVVNGISFSIDNPDDYYEDARLDAMDDAKEKATQLAHSAGVKVGKPISISEYAYYSNSDSDAQYILSESRVTTSISAGELTVSVTVQVVYAIS
jgi:uncharacterized protein YggE